MTLREVVSRAWRENILFSALIELTYRCNLDCFFCYNDLSARGVPLRFEDYERLLDDLAEMQVLDLTLSGGEPLAHPEFFRIGAAARQRGFVVRVKSNGHALRGEVAARLRDEVDPFLVEISLHGACVETHDRQTRVPGSFERLMGNLAELRQLGVRVKLNSTLTLWNEREVEAMYGLADRLGLLLRFDPAVTPRDDGDAKPLNVAPTRPGIEQLFRLQMERARRMGEQISDPSLPVDDAILPPVDGKHCGAGSSAVAIDPYGNVYPCVAWRVPVGNLHDQSISQLWAGSTELGRVREATVAVKERLASEEPVARLMSFCPGLAHRLTGREDGVTPEMRERGESLREVLVEFGRNETEEVSVERAG